MIGWRIILASACVAVAVMIAPPLVVAQQITVMDAQCKANAVSSCFRINQPDPCGGGSVYDGSSCSQLRYSYSNWLEKCSAWFEVERYGSCLRTLDHPTQSTVGAIQQGLAQVQQEMSNLNKTLRSDQRAMLNQICKSFSPRPETCDASVPAQ